MVDQSPASSPGRRTTVGVWATDLSIIAAFVVIAYYPLVFTQQVLATDEFWSDLISLAQPTYEYSGKALASGKLPLWNPYWFSGYPHLAMPSAGVFYPTTVIYGLMSFAVASKIVALLHAYLAGVFSYMLGRSVIGGRVPAVYFALTAVVGDMVLVWIRNGQLWGLQTLTWFPLAVFFVHRICRNGRWGSAAGLAVSIGLMVLGGDPQSFAFGLWFLGPYTAVLLVTNAWTDPATWRRVMLQAGLCLGGVALGLLLTAAQLLPSRELFAESIRAHGLTYDYIALDDLPHIMKTMAWFEAGGSTAIVASCRFIMVLAVVGILFSRNVANAATLFGVVICMFYILFPEWLYHALIQYLPVYSGVRGASRMCVMLWWSMAFLSALGLAAWIQRAKASPRVALGIPALALACLAIFAALPYWQRQPVATMQAVAWGAGGVGLLALLLVRPLRHRALAGPVVILVAVALELTWFSRAANTTGDPAPLTVNPDFVYYSNARSSIDRIALIYEYEFRQGTSVGMMTGDRALMGYHGLMLTHFALLFREVCGLPLALMDERGRLKIEDFTNPPQLSDYVTERTWPILDLLNVRDIVTVGRYPAPPAQLLVRHRDAFKAALYGRVGVYTNPNAMPPVFPLHEVVTVASDAEAFARMREGAVNLRQQAVLVGEFDASRVSPAVAPEQLTIEEYGAERIAVSVALSAPAILTFSEIYYPGWKATVDDADAEVLRVDTALRGVHVGAGQHEVVLRFAPDSLKRGMWISAAAGVVLAVLLALAWWPERARAETAV